MHTHTMCIHTCVYCIHVVIRHGAAARRAAREGVAPR